MENLEAQAEEVLEQAPESNKEAAKNGGHQETSNLEFPTPAGQGFSQFDPKTGWAWIGIHVPSFSFRDCWAFIKSQEFMFASTYTKVEQEQAVRRSLAVKGAPGLKGLVDKLGHR